MTFEEYLDEIAKIIQNPSMSTNPYVRHTLRNTGFAVDEIDSNIEYFQKCYNKTLSVDESIIGIYNNDDIFRRLSCLTPDTIVNLVKLNDLYADILYSADTETIERELDQRPIKTFVNPHKINKNELFDLLNYDKKALTREMICNALEINNFAYSIDEIVDMIKKNLV